MEGLRLINTNCLPEAFFLPASYSYSYYYSYFMITAILTSPKHLSSIQQDTTYFIPELFQSRKDELKSSKHKKHITNISITGSGKERIGKDGIQYGKVVESIGQRIPKTGEIMSLEKQIADSTTRASAYLHDITVLLQQAEDERLKNRMEKNNELVR